MGSKKEPQTKLEIIPIFILLIIVGALIYFVFTAIIFPINDNFTAMDEFCQREGFEEATDSSAYTSIRGRDLQIECDGERVFQVTKFKLCEERDKWMECKKEKIKYDN